MSLRRPTLRSPTGRVNHGNWRKWHGCCGERQRPRSTTAGQSQLWAAAVCAVNVLGVGDDYHQHVSVSRATQSASVPEPTRPSTTARVRSWRTPRMALPFELSTPPRSPMLAISGRSVLAASGIEAETVVVSANSVSDIRRTRTELSPTPQRSRTAAAASISAARRQWIRHQCGDGERRQRRIDHGIGRRRRRHPRQHGECHGQHRADRGESSAIRSTVTGAVSREQQCRRHDSEYERQLDGDFCGDRTRASSMPARSREVRTAERRSTPQNTAIVVNVVGRAHLRRAVWRSTPTTSRSTMPALWRSRYGAGAAIDATTAECHQFRYTSHRRGMSLFEAFNASGLATTPARSAVHGERKWQSFPAGRQTSSTPASITAKNGIQTGVRLNLTNMAGGTIAGTIEGMFSLRASP